MEERQKEQGLKSLLQSIRNNIHSSPQKPSEVIKGSKLLSTGVRNQTLGKSKVLINPVPVDIDRKRKSSMIYIFCE